MFNSGTAQGSNTLCLLIVIELDQQLQSLSALCVYVCVCRGQDTQSAGGRAEEVVHTEHPINITLFLVTKQSIRGKQYLSGLNSKLSLFLHSHYIFITSASSVISRDSI